jgi:hypothetical protein
VLIAFSLLFILDSKSYLILEKGRIYFLDQKEGKRETETEIVRLTERKVPFYLQKE